MKQFHYRGARSIRGFTLIELMVVVAIIGILVGIAVPAYQDSVRKSRRGQAKADLAEVAQAMERRYTVENRYTGADLAAMRMNQSPKDGEARYRISFVGTPTDSTFTLSAQPVGGQVGDKCGTLTLSNTGVKTPNAQTMAECWNLQ